VTDRELLLMNSGIYSRIALFNMAILILHTRGVRELCEKIARFTSTPRTGCMFCRLMVVLLIGTWPASG